MYLKWVSARSKFISGLRDFRISEFRIPGFPDSWISKNYFRISGFSDFRISGFPDFQIPGFPDFGRSLEGMLHLHVCHFPFFDGYLKYWKNLRSMAAPQPAEPGGRGIVREMGLEAEEEDKEEGKLGTNGKI